AGEVISADDEEAGVFALRSGIGLERDGGESGDFGEPRFQLTEQLAVTGGIFHRREGMQVAELGPSDRDHFGGGVELHGACRGRTGLHGRRQPQRAGRIVPSG
ncbi:MAG: hypothetical protein ACK56I_18360, partial [bacterium]